MKIKRYSSAKDFKRALINRIKKIGENDTVRIQRLLRQVAYDRLLCRLFSEKDSPWILKGGHAMELRIYNF